MTRVQKKAPLKPFRYVAPLPPQSKPKPKPAPTPAMKNGLNPKSARAAKQAMSKAAPRQVDPPRHPKEPSAADRFKAEQNYDPYTPMCGNCKHRKSTYIVLRDSLPKAVIPMRCKLGGFDIRPGGLCDKWTDADGHKLDLND